MGDFYVVKTILIHILTIMSPFLNGRNVCASDATDMTSSANVQSHGWKCDKSLSECLGNLLKENIATDVTFLLGEEKLPVHAHKAILISRSPVFYTMLHGPNAVKGDIEIPDITKETFSLLLKYLYTDQIDLDVNVVVKVFSASKKYSFERLIHECWLFIRETMNIENVGILLEESHIHKEKQVTSHCLAYIQYGAEEFLLSESLFQLSQETLYLVIKANELSISDEKIVFEAAFKWSTEKCKRQNIEMTDKNRRKILGKILYEIRFPLINDDYLLKEICSTDLLSGDEIKEVLRMKHKQASSDIFKNIPRIKCTPSISKWVFDVDDSGAEFEHAESAITFSVSKKVFLLGIRLFIVSSYVKLHEVKVLDDKQNCVIHMYDVVAYSNKQDKHEAYIMLDERVLLESHKKYSVYISSNHFKSMGFGDYESDYNARGGWTMVHIFDNPEVKSEKGRRRYMHGIVYC